MEQKKIDQAALFFKKADSDAAEWIGRAAQESLRLIRDHWGLAPGGDLRIYAMNSWPGFLFHSAPWPWCVWLGLTFPLWALRVRRIWRIAGGWMQRFGRRLAVGIKPPRLLRSGDRSMGELIFLPEENMEEKIRQLACHELTHACTVHLKLPAWLNEGLAMVTVDRLMKKPTVRAETVVSLTVAPAPKGPRRGGRKYPGFSAKNREEFIRYFVLGYWRVRFLEETRPGLLKKLLAENYRPGEWRQALAAAYPLGQEPVWTGLDRLAAAHFHNFAAEAT